jgi:hypothetical protein
MRKQVRLQPYAAYSHGHVMLVTQHKLEVVGTIEKIFKMTDKARRKSSHLVFRKYA